MTSQAEMADYRKYRQPLIDALTSVKDVILASEADKYSDSPTSPYGHCPLAADTRNELLDTVAFSLRCLNVDTSKWWES